MEKAIALDFDLEGRRVEGAGVGVEDGGVSWASGGNNADTSAFTLCNRNSYVPSILK